MGWEGDLQFCLNPLKDAGSLLVARRGFRECSVIVSQETVGDPCRFSVFLAADLSGVRLWPRLPRLLGKRRVEGMFRGAHRRARDRVFGDFF